MNAAFCIKERNKRLNTEIFRLCGVKDWALGSTDLICVNYFDP